MIATDRLFPDVRCPHCGARLDVEERDTQDPAMRFPGDDPHDATWWMQCPRCGHYMLLQVRWVPLYGEPRIAVATDGAAGTRGESHEG